MRSIRAAGALGVAGAALVAAACAGRPAQPPPATAIPTPVSERPAAQSTGLPRCTTGELFASLDETGAAAGSVYLDLVFTNTGARTCGLRGFPGVSYVAGDDGHQVGPAAETSGERGDRVPLVPGGTARARVQLVNVQNYDPADCSPTPVRGLRVHPPGDTAALFVPREGTGCARTPPGAQISVHTVTP
jgi:hypothetical protein